MRVQITSADYGELQRLHSWLISDRQVKRVARVSLSSSDDGTLGALDVIDVVLSNAIALGSLAVSVAAWREAVRARSATVFRSDAGEATMIGAGPAAVDEIAAITDPATEQTAGAD
jgi:hypothetical protein